MVGMIGFGLSISLMIRSNLGLGPWDAFHVGLHEWTGITVGTASILVGVVIVCALWLAGQRPRAGTVVNMVMIGVFIDVILPHVPGTRDPLLGLAYYLVAIGLAGVSTGLYISVALGNGPRDGLVVALSRRSGWPVRRVRTVLELLVLACGWGMGGVIGAGTVLFSLLIGPAMQMGMQLFGVLPHARIRPGLADPGETGVV